MLTDISGVPVNLTFTNSSTRQSVIIPIIDDELVEETEFTTLVLTPLTSGVMLADLDSVLIQIIDNDGKS